jgi:manganese-dependent ADP-ribose/CDP-alcohol diphosphatase|eukprot:CAMPEP_0174290270 /NCGR_PEP_ID=MMETSP0809-20121228/28152_1 /TAXON_ID=73025 ORGANISM="Eutreptiella gymnastica-like, Strain CCMP1594" /NCGR_SAMPLE_ID=MMETSP0809 /ASSEMBLY_ACC=CAM_ASM_000658 /LENGTH=329 /DNA_ID=CAMNT_0015388807 /DNA_START=60 /DNA_END=1049 /DNA_ORIENTATION=+
MSPNVTAPLFRFGVIADVQYCNCDDGTNFDGSVKRHYRGALSALGKAVDDWNSIEDLRFIAQLGDVIDGKCEKFGQSESDLADVMAQFQRCNVQEIYHCIGNHELYNFARWQLAQKLRTIRGPHKKEFYSFSPASGWRFIVLDPYQEAIIGLPIGSAPYAKALTELQQNNPNDVLHGGDWCAGLKGDQKRWVPYNGGLGDEQLEWMQRELHEAAAAGEQVVILCHVLLHPKAGAGSTMAFDFDKALSIVHASNCVVAVLCGHDHTGGYVQDDAGVHHLTFPSPLNEGDKAPCHAHVEVYPDRLEVIGSGVVPSRTLTRAPSLMSGGAVH